MRRFRKPLNGNRVQVCKFISQDYDLVMSNTEAAGGYFRTYLSWRPAGAEALDPIPQITLTNEPVASLPVSQALGTIPATEFTPWTGLYARTKLKKVIVKYTPAQTMGVSNTVATAGSATTFSAADSVMYTVPVYDNVDYFVNNSSQLQLEPDQSGFSRAKIAPYARKHSIYRPWTRVLSPAIYQITNEFPGSASLREKKHMYFDLNSTGTPTELVDVNGLYLVMPFIRPGGEAPTGTGPTLYPAVDSSWVLGKLTFTYVQYFKTRQ